MDHKQLDRIFTYHAPQGDQAKRYEALRIAAHGLADLVFDLCPESREASLAITHIQQAVMWANAAIAINEAP